MKKKSPAEGEERCRDPHVQPVVVATRNKDKVREICRIMNHPHFRLISLAFFPDVPTITEDGNTFFENALKKARIAFEHTGLPALADDSGLEVDALGGAPGVLSSRFAGEKADAVQNNMKLLRLLEGVPADRRTARFRCTVSFVNASGAWSAEGSCEGVILTAMQGAGGFGYDPLFFVPEYGLTFAQVAPRMKDRVSHRGIAFRKMAEILKGLYGEEQDASAFSNTP